jgi:hypothetical protein
MLKVAKRAEKEDWTSTQCAECRCLFLRGLKAGIFLPCE